MASNLSSLGRVVIRGSQAAVPLIPMLYTKVLDRCHSIPSPSFMMKFGELKIHHWLSDKQFLLNPLILKLILIDNRQ